MLTVWASEEVVLPYTMHQQVREINQTPTSICHNGNSIKKNIIYHIYKQVHCFLFLCYFCYIYTLKSFGFMTRTASPDSSVSSGFIVVSIKYDYDSVGYLTLLIAKKLHFINSFGSTYLPVVQNLP